MIRFIITISLLLNVHLVQSQFSISGEIRSSIDNKPLLDADVYLINNDILKKGDFTFANLSPENYSIVVFGMGYNTQELNIDLDKDTSLAIYMVPLSTELTEVVIQDQEDEIFALKRLRAVEGTAIYAGKKNEVIRLDRMMGNLASNNSRQIYAQIAGLNIYEGNNGGIQLGIGGRGLDPSRTANFNTRQNGYDISADVLGYPESYYTPPSEALEEIQIIRGAASLQYGTQFGGLINFKTHYIPSTKPFEWISKQTVGSFGFLNSFNSIGINKGRWSFDGFYNFKQGNGYRPNSKFSAHNIFLSAKYQINTKSKIRAEITSFNYLAQQPGGLTDEQFLSDPRQSNRSRNWFAVDWKLYNLKWSHKFSTRTELTASLFALDASRFSIGFRGNPENLNENPITALDERDANRNYILPRDLIKGNFRNFGTEIRLLKRYKLLNRNAIWLIGSKIYIARNQSLQGPGSKGTDADFNFYTSDFPDYANQSSFTFPNQNLAFFSEHIFYINDKFSITPGVRFEYIKTESAGKYQSIVFDNAGNPISNIELSDDQELSRKFPLFGVGLSYKENRQYSLYANISQNYRSVTFSDIRTVSPTFIIDPNIQDEKGFTSDVGVRGKMKDYLSYDLGLFAISYQDRIGIILDERANRVRKNIGNAVIYGLESMLEINILPSQEQLKLKYFTNLSLTDSRYTSSEENDVAGNRVEFIPKFNWKTGLNAGYRNFTANSQFTYLSQQYTDAQNLSPRALGDSRSGIVGTIPSYYIVDLNVAYQQKRWKIDAGINNLLNRQYFTRRATGYPGPGIIPSDGRNIYLTLQYKI